jgi:hypothetical protein
MAVSKRIPSQRARLKNCTARSCFSAAALLLKVPRFRRLPVRGFFFSEYSRYLPEASFRIMGSESMGSDSIERPFSTHVAATVFNRI